MKISLISVSALVLAQFTTSTSAAPIWSGELTVKHVEGNTNMTVYFNEAVPNPANCSQGALKTASWEMTNAAARNYMSMMLTAKAAGRSVEVLVDDSNCLWGGWPSLVSMKLL